jgi:hypothetical protein
MGSYALLIFEGKPVKKRDPICQLLVGLIVTFIAAISQAETRTALIYPLGHAEGTPQFTQKTEVTANSDGTTSWNSKIESDKGAVVMTETAEMKDGQMLHQYVEQLQVGESYELKSEGGKITFSTYKLVDGKKSDKPIETTTIKPEGPFITGPLTDDYLKKNWKDLIDGKTLSIDFGVFEVQKLIGFHFKKLSEDKSKVEIEMSASNFFISMVFDPIHLEVSKDGSKVIRFKGRVPLKKQVDGKWKPMDAEIIYP